MGREGGQEGLPRAVSPPGWTLSPFGVFKGFCLPWLPKHSLRATVRLKEI